MPRRGDSGDSDGLPTAVQFRREVPTSRMASCGSAPHRGGALETCTHETELFAVIPLLLTCIASLFLAVVGATLVVTARERNEDSRAALADGSWLGLAVFVSGPRAEDVEMHGLSIAPSNPAPAPTV
jgi:hypothetical protein